jgi:hypothetical protein
LIIPAAQSALSNLVVKSQTATSDIDSTIDGSLVGIATLSKPVVMLSSQAAADKSVNAMVSFVPSRLASAGVFSVALTGYAAIANGTLSVSNLVNCASTGTLLIEAGSPALLKFSLFAITAANVVTSFVVSGLTNPAAQGAQSSIAITSSSGDAGTFTLPVITTLMTSAYAVLSSTAPAATAVNLTAVFTPTTIGAVSIVVPTYFAAQSSGLTVTVSGGASGATLAATVSADGVLTVTGVTLAASASASTVSVVGFTNPAVRVALPTQLKTVQSSVDKDSFPFSLPAIVAVTAAPTPAPTIAPTTAPKSASHSVNQGLSYVATAGAAVAALML